MPSPKSWTFKALMVGLILAVAGLVASSRNLSHIRPASDYIDQGVYTFIPYKIEQAQQKTNYTGRLRRMHPTTTVYYVKYKATTTNKYKYRHKAGSAKTLAQEILNKKEPIDKRVLVIAENKRYICIAPSLDAETYTSNRTFKFRMMSIASQVYIGFLILLFGRGLYKKMSA